MRMIRILFLLLGAMIATAAHGAPLSNDATVGTEAGGQGWVCHQVPFEGGARLVAEASDGSTLDQPVVRFVALPEGVSSGYARLARAEGAKMSPEAEITTGPPMVARGVRFLPVYVRPLEGASLPERIEVEITFDEASGGAPMISTSGAARLHSRGFFGAMADFLTEEERLVLETEETGGYLIISAPEYLAAVEPLARWKQEKGLHVTLVTTNETGFSNTQIKAFISDAYHNAPIPPQYVLLVGDIDKIQTFGFDGSTTDHPYTLVDGDDFLPDLTIGRLSVESVTEAQTIVAKILSHEKNPYRVEGDAWFTKALMVAADYSSTTPRAVSDWCGEQLLDTGFAGIDKVYYPPHWGAGVPLITAAVNAGVSLVSYRGWAYGIHGWEPPKFTSQNVPGLANGWKLPVVFSFVCQNNDFGSSEMCFGEAWIRAGTPSTPKGAVAFLGNSEYWSHTRHNDASAIGAFRGIRTGHARQLGDILNAVKYNVLAMFPGEVYHAEYGQESAEFYFYIYALLGDPEMEVWTSAPRNPDVVHLSTVPAGGNFLEVRVFEAGSDTPVPGARVGLSRAGARLAAGRTADDGWAHIPVDLTADAEPILVTVTGEGIDPYQGTVTVSVEAGPHLVCAGAVVDDDAVAPSQGNGDGLPGPAETLELTASLHNSGLTAAAGVTATLEPMGGVEILEANAVFPDIAPGGEASAISPFVVRLDPSLADGARVRMNVRAGATGMEAVASDLVLTVAASALTYESVALDGEGVLLPGGTSEMLLRLRNDGSLSSGATQAVLRTATPLLVSVIDSTAAFAPISTGQNADADVPFRVAVDPQAAIGKAAGFVVELTEPGGQTSQTSFSLVIGVVDHRAPLGPDRHGYYAYDNSDTDYPDAAPTYEWVNCSAAYGGAGMQLPLEDNESVRVGLPFTFRYYGRDYTSIQVSDNGWVAFDTTAYYDFYNWDMPNTYGSAAQVAPFWDNLDPERMIDGARVVDGVYALYDPVDHRYVVEWSRLLNIRYDPNENQERLEDLQTFQVILFDPAHHPTPTGDGVLQFQYKQIVNNDGARMWATVGIEDDTETDGLACTYDNVYAAAAAPLSPGLAIRFTTAAPIYRPFDVAAFETGRQGSAVLLSWQPGDGRPRGNWRIYRAPVEPGGEPVGEGRLVAELAADARSFLDAEADASERWIYRVGSLDPFGHETMLGPYSYPQETGPAGPAMSLRSLTPNPARDGVELALTLPGGRDARLTIFDVAGRVVRSLLEGPAVPGETAVRWDGRDGRGEIVPSGIYFCRLDCGPESRKIKVTLVR